MALIGGARGLLAEHLGQVADNCLRVPAVLFGGDAHLACAAWRGYPVVAVHIHLTQASWRYFVGAHGVGADRCNQCGFAQGTRVDHRRGR
ncbi:hypothetical protein D3C80_1806610 [compost metagenome]